DSVAPLRCARNPTSPRTRGEVEQVARSCFTSNVERDEGRRAALLDAEDGGRRRHRPPRGVAAQGNPAHRSGPHGRSRRRRPAPPGGGRNTAPAAPTWRRRSRRNPPPRSRGFSAACGTTWAGSAPSTPTLTGYGTST